MGIFNTKIFDELEEGLNDLSKKIKQNFNEDNKKEKAETKCENCGAMLKNTAYKCEYCGAEIKSAKNFSQKKERQSMSNAEIIQYPVLVQYEKDAEGGFYAYDCQTDTGTDCYNSVAKALDEIKKSLQEILDDGYKLKFWTEEELSKKFYAKGQLKRGAKIKFVELEYLNPENDPDW